ncbi:MAG: sulfotransferase family 2 domain-containing protein [Alphaproteobacteria bacterium]
MLLSHRHKFIFLKSTKTAGTSVEMLLEPLCLPPGTSLPDEERAQQVSEFGIIGRRGGAKPQAESDTWFNHMSASAIKELVAPEIWEAYVKITIVRNPFSRVLSAFRFMNRLGGNADYRAFGDEVAAFDAWLKLGKIMGYKHIVTVNGVLVADRVLRHERLNVDLAGLIRDLKLPVNAADLPNAKKRPAAYAAPPVAAFYNDSRRDRVLTLEGWSFDAFGYSRDPEDA